MEVTRWGIQDWKPTGKGGRIKAKDRESGAMVG